MSKTGKFPALLRGDDDLQQKIDEMSRTVKFQMKRTLVLNVAVGTTELTEGNLEENVSVALRYFLTLLKNGKGNIKKLYLKSSMGSSVRFY